MKPETTFSIVTRPNLRTFANERPADALSHVKGLSTFTTCEEAVAWIREHGTTTEVYVVRPRGGTWVHDVSKGWHLSHYRQYQRPNGSKAVDRAFWQARKTKECDD